MTINEGGRVEHTKKAWMKSFHIRRQMHHQAESTTPSDTRNILLPSMDTVRILLKPAPGR